MLASWLVSQQIELASAKAPQRWVIKIPRMELINREKKKKKGLCGALNILFLFALLFLLCCRTLLNRNI